MRARVVDGIQSAVDVEQGKRAAGGVDAGRGARHVDLGDLRITINISVAAQLSIDREGSAASTPAQYATPVSLSAHRDHVGIDIARELHPTSENLARLMAGSSGRSHRRRDPSQVPGTQR